MIQVTKISNKDDGFILNYYLQTGDHQIVIVNSQNITEELNDAFIQIKKDQEDSRAKQQEREKYYAQGALGSQLCGPNVLGSAIGSIREAD